MTEAVAAQQDQSRVPDFEADEDVFERWTLYADQDGSDAPHLRPPTGRGRPSATPVDPPRDYMVDLWHRIGLDERRESFRTAIESPTTDPAIGAAMRSYLDGEPDPLGAAAVFEIAFAVGAKLWGERRYVQYDAWHGEHGPEFAACAVLQQSAVRVIGARFRQPLHHYNNGSDEPAVEFAPTIPAGGAWGRGMETQRVREMLAGVPEPEYRRYRELFEPLGRNHRQRHARAFVMPTEQDWVDQACNEFPEWESRAWGVEEQLIASVTSIDQLTAAGITILDEYNRYERPIRSLLESCGPDAVPLLVETLNRGTEPRGRGTLKTMLATLPHDAAVEYLLTGWVGEETAHLARLAAERFPRRTVRAVVRLADGAAAAQRSRYAHLTTAVPALAEAVAAAEPEVRQAIDRLVHLDDAPPETPDVPAFLANPPWTLKRPKVKRTVIEVAPVDAAVLRWRDGERETWAEGGKIVDETRRRLAEGEAEAVPEVLAALAKAPRHHRALPPIGGVEAARIAADWLVRLRSTRASVTAWLARHGTDAAAWLTPDAIGPAGKTQRAAEAVLRHLARAHGDAAVLAAAAGYGAEAAVTAILTADPLDLHGRKAPRVPEWVEPVLGMPVLLAGRGHRLPRAAVGHLVGAMALDSLAIPYAGLDAAKEHCDAASLSEFSWAVFESWLIADAPGKDSWAFTQLARFADAGTVERLEALIGPWTGAGLVKRAQTALEVLGAVDAEEALLAVHRLRRTVDSKALKESAADQIDLIAAGMGLDVEQLADSLVPDFELGEDATLELGYGSRRFKVGFDERLRPFVIDERGKVRRSLPKPDADDDPEAAAEAAKRFERLTRGLKSVATEQVPRLERAMVDGRTWTLPEFRRHLVDHALMWHLAKRLVWRAESAAGAVVFRLAEDRTCTGADEDALALPEDARIRLAHPVLLGDALPVWAEILADYEILQPFDQLARPVHAPTGAEASAGRLTRFEGGKGGTGALFNLTRKGWRPVRKEGSGWTSGLSRRLAGGGAVEVDLSPGFGGGYLFDAEEVQVLQSVRFPTGADPVALSEVIATLARVAKSE
ncbi:DUF4132 domain-containing protein [Glycomyces harbinensis]|uniref:DUF4132 domain-containing protein n=1 Tax=Glycomyces harbinensis TaxID=58114 RepID=A0A1G6WLP0_9ACTN|nr:DUF4132 domain-containing protein [Glycomyces harbinensis]SDD66137.1 protein of unknown function [Glycomyces harbinensis]